MAQRSNFIVRGGADFSQLNKALNQTQVKISAFQGAVSKSMKLISVALSIIAVGKIAKEYTQAAMAVESAMDNIQRNMGASASAFTKFVDTQSKSLAMAKKDAYTYGSVFSNLLASFVGGTEQVANETQKLMQAAAVIASKTGRTYEDVANRIRSGLLGSTEAIEDLGVYTNISMIESTEAFKKFANGKSWNQLTFQTQQQIRLAAILEQAYKRYGDTLADTTATKQAQFLASLQNIKLNLGQAFLPIYNTILPALTALAERIENITAHIAAFTQALFGKATATNVKGIEQQTEAITEQGNAIEKAGKQAKGSIAPFDEINQIVLGNKESENAGTVGTSVGPVIDTKTIETNDSFATSVEKLKDKIQPTIDALDELKRTLKPITKFAFDNLKNFHNEFLVPVGTWVLGEGVPGLVDVLTELVKDINWDKLTDALGELYSALSKMTTSIGTGLIEFAKDATKFIKPVLTEAINLLAISLKSLAEWINSIDKETWETAGYCIGIVGTAIAGIKITSSLPTLIVKLRDGLGGLVTVISNLQYMDPVALPALFDILGLDEWLDELYMKLPDWVKKLWEGFWQLLYDFVLQIFNYDETAKIWQQVAQAFKDAYNADTWYEAGWNVIKGILLGIVGTLGFLTEPVIDFFTSLWNNFKEVFGIGKSGADKMKPVGQDILKGIMNGFKEKFTEWWTSIVEWGKTTSSKFGTEAKNVWNSIKDAFKDVKSWFSTKFSEAWKGVKKVFDPVTDYFNNIWKGITEGFSRIMGKLGDLAKTPVNAVIRILNTLIDALNKISIDIPDWDILPNSIQGKKFGFNLSRIPYLRDGMVIPPNFGEFAAILGDNPTDTEVVTPLNTLKQAIREEIGAGNGMIHVTLMLPNGKVLLDTIVEADREHIAQTGRSAFMPA